MDHKEIQDDMTVHFKDSDSPASKIKVLGVGGGGCNAINYMYEQNIPYISFSAINTDKLHLDKIIKVPDKLVLGPGLGAGDDPAKGRKYAEEDRERIRALFDENTEMVFITAGMGGGTGTGAAPVVAQIAKEAGLLTIGIITIPFLFEGKQKITKALAGAEEMRKHVDALLMIRNQSLVEIYKDLSLRNAFRKADDTLANAARSISEIISEECYIDVDMEDVRTTLKDSRNAIISTAYGEGEGRISKAIENALHSPLLRYNDLLTAQRVLIKLSHADEEYTQHPVKIDELNELTEFTSRLSQNFKVKWGVGINNELGDKVKLTLLVTGFDLSENEKGDNRGPIIIDGDNLDDGDGRPANGGGKDSAGKEESKIRISDIYTAESMFRQQHLIAKSKYVVLKPSQFDDDEVIALVEHTPAFNRSISFKEKMRHIAVETTRVSGETQVREAAAANAPGAQEKPERNNENSGGNNGDNGADNSRNKIVF